MHGHQGTWVGGQAWVGKHQQGTYVQYAQSAPPILGSPNTWGAEFSDQSEQHGKLGNIILHDKA